MERKFFVDISLTKETFFLGTVSDNENVNIGATIVLDIYRYTIWQSKLEKRVTSDSEFFNNMIYMINLVCCSSIKIRDLLSNCAIIDVLGRGRHRRDGSP
jgi:hypothetical protein